MEKIPFLVVNPKSYMYGKELVSLAKSADKIAKKTGVPIYFTAPFIDVRAVRENTAYIKVTAQHMDAIPLGRGMGRIVPESVLDAGVSATFLNHAEHSLTVAELSSVIFRAKEVGIETIVCADSVAEGVSLSLLQPDIILCEPTELIGTGVVADDGYIVETIQRVRQVNDQVQIMIASGITTADDVYNVIYKGVDGTGATSGILQAPDPVERIEEMARAILEAVKDRRGRANGSV